VILRLTESGVSGSLRLLLLVDCEPLVLGFALEEAPTPELDEDADCPALAAARAATMASNDIESVSSATACSERTGRTMSGGRALAWLRSGCTVPSRGGSRAKDASRFSRLRRRRASRFSRRRRDSRFSSAVLGPEGFAEGEASACLIIEADVMAAPSERLVSITDARAARKLRKVAGARDKVASTVRDVSSASCWTESRADKSRVNALDGARSLAVRAD